MFLTNYALRHEDVWRSECIDPCILVLGTGWRCVVSFTVRPLYPRGMGNRYPLDWRLGGPQNRSGRRGEEQNLAPTRTRNATQPPKPVARLCTNCAIPAQVIVLYDTLHKHTSLQWLIISNNFRAPRPYVSPCISSWPFTLSLTVYPWIKKKILINWLWNYQEKSSPT
jgi:hypothetical protein